MEAQRQGAVNRWVAGIDPGITGAVSFTAKGCNPAVYDLEILRVHSKGYVDSYVLRHLLKQYDPGLIVIELAGARQMQGVASITQTWLVYGGIVATAMTMNCPVEIVSPLKWKRALGLLGADKEVSRAKALKLYPELADQLRRKKDHNRAESLLLAHWGLGVV